MDQDLTKHVPRTVKARFELAAARLADAWTESGTMVISVGDLALATEYLTQVGWQVKRTSGLLVRLTDRDGQTKDVSREQAVMVALRELADGR